jgi:hypothetical protein
VFLKTRELAFTGVLMALSVILVTLGGYVEGSTLFFLAAASFLTGVVQRNLSFGAAAAFLTGTTLLSVILAPQKLYCATYAAFSVYVIIAEALEKAFTRDGEKKRRGLVWAAKAVVYHALLFTALFLVQKLFGWEMFFQGRIFAALKQFPVLLGIMVVLCAEAVWLLFDRAYFYVQNRYGMLFSKWLHS